MRVALGLLLFSFSHSEINTGKTETIFEFSRRLDTCDDRDVPISDEGTTPIVYAYSENDRLEKHTVRGSRSLRLFQDQTPFNPIETDLKTEEVRFPPYTVPFNDKTTGNTTSYYCLGFKLTIPEGEKVHMIRWEPITEGKAGFVHHMLMYDCGILSNESIGYTGHCYDYATMPADLTGCNGRRMVAGWAVGGMDTVFPPHVGFPLGENGTEQYSRYVMLEIHYDNPQGLTDVIDSSGFRLTYTKQLRANDAGTLILGSVTDPRILIPPETAKWEWNTWCPGDCTQKLLDQGPVNLFGGILHSHTAGRAISVRHARGGVELPPIANDSFYDFNLQDFDMYPQEIVLEPGDAIYTTCVYNTVGRPNPTNFGLSTREEMCLTFILYYPRLATSNPGCAYSNTPQGGENVYCGDYGRVQNSSLVPIAVPRQIPPCTREGIPANESQIPVLRSVDEFNPNDYARHEYLDDDKNFLLHWKADRNESLIRFAVQVNTGGWVGLGISPNKGMPGADIAMGYFNGSEPMYADRMAMARMLPEIDALQDFFAVSLARGVRGTAPPTPDTPPAAAWKIYVPVLAGIALLFGCLLVMRVMKKSNKKTMVAPEKAPDKYGALGTKDEPVHTA